MNNRTHSQYQALSEMTSSPKNQLMKTKTMCQTKITTKVLREWWFQTKLNVESKYYYPKVVKNRSISSIRYFNDQISTKAHFC